MEEPAFYDVHCHLMNLSHPAFVSIIESMRHRPREIIYSQLASFDYLAASLLNRGGERLRNLLAVMDNDCADILFLMEDDLAGQFSVPKGGKKFTEDPPLRNGSFRMAGKNFSKVVLTPLIMDFSTPASLSPNTYYKRPPRKPIDAQIIDVMYAIRKYVSTRPDGALRVYPFWGINTKNHSFAGLSNCLTTWFSNYTRDERELERRFRATSRHGMDVEVQHFGLFAGIKLYPPLGFDPWPDDPEEREKVDFLYSFAESKRIPITTHCDDQGYRIIGLEDSLRYTAPSRYEPVLERHPNLILNFAHMGKQHIRTIRGKEQADWRKDIFRLIVQYPHVYTDFSFIGVEPQFYEELASVLAESRPEDEEKLSRRILFGSDFSVNLLKIRSYRDYMEIFSQSSLSNELKLRFCAENPRNFLFGER